MKHFLGIDAGGTHTTACLTDSEGIILAHSEAGLGNPNHASDEELHAHFSGLLQEIVLKGHSSMAAFVSVFAGVAGVTCEKTRQRIRNILGNCGVGHAVIGVDHDIRIALAGGLAGRPGMALIVGTGSSCYGRDASGNTWQTGGWGALIADEGSGYFLGREAIAAAVRMADGRQMESLIGQEVFDWLGIRNASAILNRIYQEGLTRAEIAAFAPTVVDLAAKSDPAARDILTRGAADLALMVAANHGKLPTSREPELVITGGLGTADSFYRPMIEKQIRRALPSVQIQEPAMAPATGAALLAIEQCYGTVTPEAVNNLKGQK